MKIKLKLPAFVIICTVIPALLVAWLALRSTGPLIERNVGARQNLILWAKMDDLKAVFEKISIDSRFITEDRDALEAFVALKDAWSQKAITSSYLQRLFIANNPNPPEKRYLLNDPGDGSAYSVEHAKFNPWFKRFADQAGYQDIYLIDRDGNVIYSIAKNADFATNVLTGLAKNSDLAEVFRKAMMPGSKLGDTFISDYKPYVGLNNAAAGFIASPIFDEDGTKMGAVILGLPIERISNIFNDREGLESAEEIYIVGPDQLNRTYIDFGQKKNILGFKLDSESAALALNGNHSNTESINYNGQKVIFSCKKFIFGDIQWDLIVEESKDFAYAAYNAERSKMIIYITISLIIIGGLAYLFSLKLILLPLSHITRNLNDLSADKVDVDLYGLDRRDEFLDIANSARAFKDNLIKTRLLQQQQKEIEQKAELTRKQMLQKLADTFEERMRTVVATLASASTELAQTAENMHKRSSSSNHTAASASDSANLISTHVESVSSAASELYSSVSEISEQVHRSSDLITDSVHKVHTADTHAKKLGESSQQVREVIQLIADISSQINLLALNATIESARAGESGKGFAVVANEVKNLANQTNKSVEEIGKVIDQMANVSEDMITALEDIKGSVNKISESSVSIASAVEEQTVATNGIAKSAREASDGTRSISNGLRLVTDVASEVNMSSQQMLEAAVDLSRQAEELNVEVNRFILEIRNA